MTNEVRKLNPLTSLRFIAAGLILVHHLRGMFGLPDDYTLAFSNGVSFFFVLSGFILTYVYSSRPRLEKRRFLIARFARLYPAHIAAFFLLCALFPETVANEFSITKLFAYLFLVQSWIPIPAYNVVFVGPSWSISTEFAFYLCFLFLIRNWNRTWLVKLFGSAVVLAGMMCLAGFVIKNPRFQIYAEAGSLLYVNPLGRLFEFVLGMTAAGFWSRYGLHARSGKAVATILECGAVLLVVFAMLHVENWSVYAANYSGIGEPAYRWLVNSGICCVAFALLIYVMASENGYISRILSLPLLVLLGELSYSFYLIHQTLIESCRRQQRAFELLPTWLQLTWFCIFALALSYVIWAGIEWPCRRFLVSLWPKPSYAVAAELPSSMIDPAGVPIKVKHRGLIMPSRSGFATAFVIIAMSAASIVYLIRFHPSIQLVTDAVARRQISRESGELSNVNFGGKFLLYGVAFERRDGQLELHLFWKSLARQKLEWMNGIHLVDQAGNIRGQKDYSQDPSRGMAREGQMWHDVVRMSYGSLAGMHFIGIVPYNGMGKDLKTLAPDRGLRDWDNHRLLIPVPADLTNPGGK